MIGVKYKKQLEEELNDLASLYQKEAELKAELSNLKVEETKKLKLRLEEILESSKLEEAQDDLNSVIKLYINTVNEFSNENESQLNSLSGMVEESFDNIVQILKKINTSLDEIA